MSIMGMPVRRGSELVALADVQALLSTLGTEINSRDRNRSPTTSLIFKMPLSEPQRLDLELSPQTSTWPRP